MKDGRQSLLIGGLFLTACLVVSNVFVGQSPGTFLGVARESLTIAVGWRCGDPCRFFSTTGGHCAAAGVFTKK